MEYACQQHNRCEKFPGLVAVYNGAVRWRYMVTSKARRKYEILVFWEKHGLAATRDAFRVGRRTLYLWKRQLRQGGGKPEALNERTKAPRNRRTRIWPLPLITEIRRLREAHPNLGKEKIAVLLRPFCATHGIPSPSASTVGRLLKDLGGLRAFPRRLHGSGAVTAVRRSRVLRKPKHLRPDYPGHCVALDTIERFIDGCRRYVITFEDVFSRFSFAWCTTSHASAAAREFLRLCRIVFPAPVTYVLTDNGSEFKKHFAAALAAEGITHYHTYPKTPKMNAHCERFNRTIQEEFLDYHTATLRNPQECNIRLMDWLVWYNTIRPHHSLDLRSPLQVLLEWASTQQECNYRWTDTGF